MTPILLCFLCLLVPMQPSLPLNNQEEENIRFFFFHFYDIIEGGGALSSPSAQKMGAGASSSSSSNSKREMRSFREKVRQLQEEIAAIMKARERESKSYRRDAMVFATKEAEWRKERRKLREELRRLRTMEGLEDQSQQLEMMMLGERMREERARRDEAIGRWKQLYLAIKTELDDLIRSARYGWKVEEEEAETAVVEELRKEALEREAMIASLRSREASLEQEKVKLERDVDILRQSLRIISSSTNTSNKATSTTKKNSLP